MSRHLERLANAYSSKHDPLFTELDRTLNPRGPEILSETAGHYLGPNSLILDVGCRDALYLIRLVKEHSARGVGLDPLPEHMDRANQAVRDAELADRIEIVRGRVESLPWPDATFDFIWCRDVLEDVEYLAQGLGELRRTIRSDGHILIYTVFETDLMEPRESAALHGALGGPRANMKEHNVEDEFRSADLVVELKDVIGTEWREYEEERTQPVSRNLLRLARLRRNRREVLQRFGEDGYRVAEASLQWLPYLLMGKLKPVLYILRRG
jgi:ubiquinone/menaquinone biosynthesis C-methylase UbiE